MPDIEAKAILNNPTEHENQLSFLSVPEPVLHVFAPKRANNLVLISWEKPEVETEMHY